MQVTTTINEAKELIKKWKKDGKSIGPDNGLSARRSCKPDPEMPGGK